MIKDLWLLEYAAKNGEMKAINAYVNGEQRVVIVAQKDKDVIPLAILLQGNDNISSQPPTNSTEQPELQQVPNSTKDG